MNRGVGILLALAFACAPPGGTLDGGHPSPPLEPEAGAPLLNEPLPDPEPEPSSSANIDEPALPDPPRDLDATEIAALLAEAEVVSREELGIAKSPRRASRAAMGIPGSDELRTAYAEGRAIGFPGRVADVRRWMGKAKFGAEDPGPLPSKGPLARHDLVVTWRSGDEAWFHVVVPKRGLAPADQIGLHRSTHQVGSEVSVWRALCDLAGPGKDYLPVKREDGPSLHRQWGREAVVRRVAELAQAYSQRTGELLGVGDISHVSGGKMLDHWTHRLGVDVDLYILGESGSGADRIMHHTFRRGLSIWSTRPSGGGDRETPDEEGSTASARRLRTLAELVLPHDEIAYFVHDDPTVLESFDAKAQERKPGRRYLHARNRGYWPEHSDHVHLRFDAGRLPTGTPRP